MKKVCMIVTDGFEEVEALSVVAILSRGGVQVDVYSLLDKDATGRYGVIWPNLKSFSEMKVNDYEAIVIPTGPGWNAIEANEDVQNWLKDFNSAGKYLCAICAAPTMLGRAGFLKDRNYTCFKKMNDDFGGTYHEQYVVTDGNIITGCSVVASIEFAFAILEAVLGKEVANKVRADVYYDFK